MKILWNLHFIRSIAKLYDNKCTDDKLTLQECDAQDKFDPVWDITDKDIKRVTTKESEKSLHIIEFYATWCPHCKHYVPEYKELGNKFKQQQLEGKVRLIAYDCASENLCGDFGIESYPTVKVFGPGIDSDAKDHTGKKISRDGLEKQVDAMIQTITIEQVKGNLRNNPNNLRKCASSKTCMDCTLNSCKWLSKDKKCYQHSNTETDDKIITNSEDCDKEEPAFPATKAHEGDMISTKAKQTEQSKITVESEHATVLKSESKHDLVKSNLIKQLEEAQEEKEKEILPSEHGILDDNWTKDQLDATTLDHMWDAFVAVFESLHMSTFLHSKKGNLPDDVWDDIVKYLEYITQHFPNESLRGALVQFFRSVKEKGKPKSESQWREFVWKSHDEFAKMLFIDGYRYPIDGLEKNQFFTFASCDTYTCRQWTLFHVLAQEATNKNLDHISFFNIARIFRKQLFGCEECANHFGTYMDEHRTDMKVLKPSVWFWRFHNVVTERVQKGHREQFPPMKLCDECQDDLIGWDEVSVADYLHKKYTDQVNQDFFGSRTFSIFKKMGIFTLCTIVVLTCFILALCIGARRKSEKKANPDPGVYDAKGKEPNANKYGQELEEVRRFLHMDDKEKV